MRTYRIMNIMTREVQEIIDVDRITKLSSNDPQMPLGKPSD